MKDYSVWNIPYTFSYKLRHPLKCASYILSNIKGALQRAKYGYTYSDVWNMYDWILHTFPPMLRHMAENGMAAAKPPKFRTEKEWHDWLYHVIDLLESGLEENQDKKNEYYPAYKEYIWEKVEGNSSENKDEIITAYSKRAEEIELQAMENVKQAMAEIGENFFYLWD